MLLNRRPVRVGHTLIIVCALTIITTMTGCSALLKNEQGADSQDSKVPRVGESFDAEDVQSAVEADATFRTVAEAKARISALGHAPIPLELAKAISEIQDWTVRPEEEEEFQGFQSDQLIGLRQLIVAEVRAHQDAALTAKKSPESAAEFSVAQRMLVLYPLSDEENVIEQAQQLSARQAEISVRLEALRRQRYNRWAIDQTEDALNYFNQHKSKSVLSDRNKDLVGPMARRLGEIDPALLEPVVSDLYRDVLDKVKGRLSAANWTLFAKQLTDPKLVRKSLGEI